MREVGGVGGRFIMEWVGGLIVDDGCGEGGVRLEGILAGRGGGGGGGGWV